MKERQVLPMIDIETYLHDPCGSLSIPYWKARETVVPYNMRIVHSQDYRQEDYGEYEGEPYFRLKHDLQNIPAPLLSHGYQLCDIRIHEFAQHINSCYTGIGISTEALSSYTRRKVYEPALWIAVKDISADTVIASGIGELDRECGEGILEWIQVSEGHRHRGLGTYVVCELLQRMAGKAAFATVSGKCSDRHDPEGLYRECGFTGSDVWHVLRK